jgi:mono/diheme cytochrome c family protein
LAFRFEQMNRRAICSCVALVPCAFLLGSCETTSSSAPPITAAFVRAGAHQDADARTLAQGRSLLLNRCIQCHALPEVSKFDPPRLTVVVAKMSGRANMNPEQHDAVLKYLLTVRSQKTPR